ncbi:response regulator [candidate division KSB1 bacterium]|nr:response regulator [candidate division KSB1 bacterium]
MPATILVADTNDAVRQKFCHLLALKGFECWQASDDVQAIERLKNKILDVAIIEINPPDMDGLKVLQAAIEMDARASFIMTTENASLETAISSLRKGAVDYIIKPLPFDQVIQKIDKLIANRELMLENMALRQEIHSQYDFTNIVGNSESIQQLCATISKISESDSHVLITGASGTGKELVSKSIHYHSSRKRGPFVALNCAALTETLFESELFGHKKGSFTGAVADKKGLITHAHRGTLFLDEIGELSLASQSKLLRVLETQQVLPVGATEKQQVNVRIIAATHRDLLQEITKGTFREDLYYRLAVIEIYLPPLSERREDIPLLVQHFIRKYNKQMNRSVKGVDPRLMDLLVKRIYKGQVRELENLIERLMIFAESDHLTFDSLPSDLRRGSSSTPIPGQASNLKSAVEEFEKSFILKVLKENDYHRGKTAKELDIGEATLYRKMKDLAID